MRRSILIVMLDVMVLSVLALTVGKQSGGSGGSLPIPLYRWSSMIEEGLRKEQSFKDQIKRLEEQLAQATEVAKKALEQAESAQSNVGRERSGNEQLQARLREAELAAEKARSQIALTAREAELAAQRAAAAEQKSREMARRAAEAQAEKDAALARAQAAEAAARVAAEQRVQEVARREAAAQAEKEAALARAQAAEQRAQEVALREAAARAQASAVLKERQRLALQNEQTAEKLTQLREKLAALEVQKENEARKVAQLEKERRQALEASKKSVWVQRDAALRRLTIHYTEYNSYSDRSYTTSRELVMPMVKVGKAVLIPADFRKLGLNASFFGGLSDRVSDVTGGLSPLTGTGDQFPIRTIIVPGTEPQVCFVQFDGSVEGALESISMAALKEQRLKSALLFSPDDVNAYGEVEINPVFGSDYLKVRSLTGDKPAVGDYLMSDKGEFIGVMVTKEDCYVTPQVLSRTPPPVQIPLTSANPDETYFTDFIQKLQQARALVKEHLAKRSL